MKKGAIRNGMLISFPLAIVLLIVVTSFSRPGSKKDFPSPDRRHVATVHDMRRT
jgi:hypothetical protein